eukprot:gene149-251_t
MIYQALLALILVTETLSFGPLRNWHRVQSVSDMKFGEGREIVYVPWSDKEFAPDEKDSAGLGAGGHEDGGFFHFGPRPNKPSIDEKAVVVLPPMDKIERGYSDAKAEKKRNLARQNGLKESADEHPFSEEDDALIMKMVAEWPAGKRGQWVAIGKALNRPEQGCLYRYTQYLNADYETGSRFNANGVFRWGYVEYNGKAI